MKKPVLLSLAASVFFLLAVDNADAQARRTTQSFNKGWKFFLGEADASANSFNDATWRNLDLPHDWSIELPFDKTSPTGTGGGALRGGIGWYRKTFTIPATALDKNVFIEFDGVYSNSEVWVNGNYLGKRPNGYISFRYEIGKFLKYGNEKNVIAVKVNNAPQPNSRWYSGSGIYRNVWLTITNKLSVDQWGTYITTANIDNQSASVQLNVTVGGIHAGQRSAIYARTVIYDPANKIVASNNEELPAATDGKSIVYQEFRVKNPMLWSLETPRLYKAVTQITVQGKVVDEYTTLFGIRYFSFDKDKGFFLNGKHVKINGVCNHHDLGCLGTAINTRALQRQLEIMKAMGVNSIRTSHNPPAPELLELCDKMGFIVMDEAFDMWKIKKTDYDYHLVWDEWHRRDLEDQVMRDRNHPSVMIWSIGNEVVEQWNNKDSSSAVIARELASIVRSLDPTRPITDANNNTNANNPILTAGAVDLVGYNYSHNAFPKFHERFPGKIFIATETVSALMTRGHYDMPSDTIRRWPERWDKPMGPGNPDTTCSAYDNCSNPWGSTHEETWKIMKKYDFLSGQYIWTGFDYIGEPTPYEWPARSSYFGIVDLAGFPKDVYYMYQSEWTNKTVLHVFPHWNLPAGRQVGDIVDVWAYYNNADEVELFLNGKSLGVRQKTGDDLHVSWHVVYEPGTIKAVSRKNGVTVLTKEIKTAGKPAKIILSADRKNIKADGKDLSFVTATIVDANGVMVPDANHLIRFTISGEGSIAGLDNGCQTDLSSFQSNPHKAFNGLCLAVIKSKEKAGTIKLSTSVEGLKGAEIIITSK